MTNPYDTHAASQADQTTAYITAQLQQGIGREAVIAALIQNGWTHSDAEIAVGSALASLGRQRVTSSNAYASSGDMGLARSQPGGPQRYSPAVASARFAALRHVVFGFLWLVGGIAVTAITYYSDLPFYIIFYGAIIGGAFEMVLGLARLANAK